MSIGGKEFHLNYEDAYPSLKVDLIVSSPDSSNPDKYLLKDVLLDTGCERTIIPNEIVRKLGLKYSGNTKSFTGFNEDFKNKVKIRFYHAKLIIDGVEEEIFEVGGGDFSPLIGMDLIHRWHLLSNAPFSTFEIANAKDYTGGRPSI